MLVSLGSVVSFWAVSRGQRRGFSTTLIDLRVSSCQWGATLTFPASLQCWQMISQRECPNIWNPCLRHSALLPAALPQGHHTVLAVHEVAKRFADPAHDVVSRHGAVQIQKYEYQSQGPPPPCISQGARGPLSNTEHYHLVLLLVEMDHFAKSLLATACLGTRP